MLAHIHPCRLWFAPKLAAASRKQLSPARSPRTVLRPPSAQSPFARLGCYLCRGGVAHHLEGRYPFFVAHTGSCARPYPSRLLRHGLVRRVFAGCYQPLLGDGPSRRYLCESFSGCLDLYPGGSQGAHTRFFPCDIGLPHPHPAGRRHNTPTVTSAGLAFRGRYHS